MTTTAPTGVSEAADASAADAARVPETGAPGTWDVIVVGGGIVGLATAWKIGRQLPGRRVLVLEKEDRVAAHQTGHNSGVLHSGIYYKPGSLKAENCRRGVDMMKAFCADHGIAHDVCGKVIVATDDSELPAMQNVFERGTANGVDCRLIGPEELKELEPHSTGVGAIHVAEAGIVDYREVCETLGRLIEAEGGEIRLGSPVRRVTPSGDGVEVEVGGSQAGAPIKGRMLINCGGLQSDRVARSAGTTPDVRIVPFRGEYYKLTEASKGLVKNLIYPVPDPRYPFLGVHFTRMIDGAVECGPNAVLALAREGYTWGDISPTDLMGVVTTPGFWRFAATHWRTAVSEIHRSLSRAAFVASLQKLVPEIRSEDIEPAPAGVRAQAMASNGKLLDDFSIFTSDRVVNVLNAPSPAATSSLSIGETIAERASKVIA